MKKLLFISALFWAIIFLTPEIKAQTPPDSCLKMMWPDSTWKVHDDINNYDYLQGSINRDSIRIDSCIGSPTYGKEYAKRFFSVYFKSYPFANAIPKDSIYNSNLIVNNHTKQQIQNLETKFGNFHFVRYFVDYEYSDSIIYASGWVYFKLDKYYCADSVYSYFVNNVDSVNTLELKYYAKKFDKPLTDISTLDFNSRDITPNPVDNFLNLNIENISEKIEIFTIEGITIKEMQYQSKIDVSFLSTGIYFLKANNKFYKFVKK